MEMGKLAVFAVDLQVHRPTRCAARRAADVRDLLFKAGRQHDLRPRLLPADHVADRLAGHLDIARYRQSPTPAVDIYLEVDGGEHGLMHCGHRRRVDREHGRERVGVLAGHDFEQGVALLRAGALIDEGEGLAIPLVNCSRPFEEGTDLQAVERSVAMLSLIDLDTGHGIAVAFIRKGIELAWAAIFASTIDELASGKFPVSHSRLLGLAAAL